VDFILQYPPRGVPSRYARADVCDGSVLNIWLWWQDRRRELSLLKRGVKVGVPFSELGSLRRIGRQGIQDRIDALEALLERGRPDAKIWREKRTIHRGSEIQDKARTQWLARNHDWLAEVAGNLIERAQDIASDDAYAILLQVKRDLRIDGLTVETLTLMSLLVEYLRVQPEVISLAPQHRLKAACVDVDEIHHDFTHFRRKKVAGGGTVLHPDYKPKRRPPRKSARRAGTTPKAKGASV
jgi:hypothetical protein